MLGSRSKLTGFLSRHNMASHRCYTRHKALPFVRHDLIVNVISSFQKKNRSYLIR